MFTYSVCVRTLTETVGRTTADLAELTPPVTRVFAKVDEASRPAGRGTA